MIRQRVVAQWENGSELAEGVVVRKICELRDQSTVYSVRISGTEYAFNERDLTLAATPDPCLEVVDRILARLRVPLADALREEGL